MTSDLVGPPSPADHRQFAVQIATWLQARSAVTEEIALQVAMDLADLFHAAGEARRSLNAMLSANPQTTAEAEAVLQDAANLEVQLLVELRQHLKSLAKVWPAVSEGLERTTSSRGDT